MDPMNQSAQISSSQGIADGHNSAAKDSKISNSFLSSSPVSLIQSPQDKRVQGSDKNGELQFSQSPSSPTGDSGSQSDDVPDSPIKTSPVSERIKALEALAAKKKEPDFRSDGYSNYRDRHTDKRSSIEIQKAAFEKNDKSTTSQNKVSSSDKESPDSPFEVLGECKQLKELEETEEWMKAHIPPVPDFHSDDSTEVMEVSETVRFVQEKEDRASGVSSFTSVPDAFMDSPVKYENVEVATVPQNPYGEECDFDLSFLPTAYMCTQEQNNYDSVVSQRSVSPEPVVEFESKLPPAQTEKTKLMRDPDPPEAGEVDSSGESDDTVIEDEVPVQASDLSESKMDTSSNPPKDEESPPAKSERKLMQVPTINVIETDDPNYSEEEMDLESEEDENVEVQETPFPDDYVPERPFADKGSPSSSPVESPKHKTHEPSLKAVGPQEPQSESLIKAQFKDDFPNVDPVEDFSDHDDEWDDQMINAVNPIITAPDPASFTKPKMNEIVTKDTDLPLETHKPPTTLPHDDSYDREFFDYDYDAPPSPDNDSEPDLAIDPPYTNPFIVNTQKNATQSNVGETFTKQNNDNTLTNQESALKQYPQDPYSIFYTAPKSNDEPDVDNGSQYSKLDDNCNKIKDLDSETRQAEQPPTTAKEDTYDLNPSCPEPADSFVEFMRECLMSKKDEEAQDEDQTTSDMTEDLQASAVMDLEQEKLTITALKDLGGSQEEEVLLPPQNAQPIKVDPSLAPTQHNTESPCPSNTQLPISPSNPSPDGPYVREVEAVDEWMAEAYHLAEHVLTAVLTHLSVKDLIHWRDPKKSGVVFGVSMLLLLSLAAFSVISVASYLLLALLCVTITFRIYKSVVQAVQKSSDGHPFKSLIEKDVSIPPETFRKHVDSSLTYINRALKQLSRLFLVEDLVDSLKLAVVMWLLTYVGAVFNGITILILADILLFAVPPVYEKNKTQIDQYIDLARTHINSTMAKLQEKLPGAMKRTKSE
ncbi:unnamed protein product [Knipowitschia caucasica]